MRRSGPEESAGPKHARDFLQKQTRLGKMFQDLRGSHHVKVLRRESLPSEVHREKLQNPVRERA